MRSLNLPSRWLLATSPALLLLITHSLPIKHMHTHDHSLIYARTRITHTFSSGRPRHRWKTALPLCCTLLHLELWASCIFNRGNLHRPSACHSILCQWDCLSPYLHSSLTLQLLFRGHINHRPWYRRLLDDIVFHHAPMTWEEEKKKRLCGFIYSSKSPSATRVSAHGVLLWSFWNSFHNFSIV